MEGSISHVLEDGSSILLGLVIMRSLTALKRWKHQQLETLVEWQLGRVFQDEFMKPSELSLSISSKWQAQSHPSLPASTSAIPFHHIPALQVWWQTSTLKATLRKSVFKNVRLKTWYRERGVPRVFFLGGFSSKDTLHLLTGMNPFIRGGVSDRFVASGRWRWVMHASFNVHAVQLFEGFGRKSVTCHVWSRFLQ